jgi:decaprenyl-phosphate phosphoribosyltransferase
MKLIVIMRLLRVKQWPKNLLILAAPLGGGLTLNWQNLTLGITAFVTFSFLASGVYILNDYHDRFSDRNHAVKRFRPIASGEFPEQIALLFSFILISLVFFNLVDYPSNSTYTLLSYLIINILYTFKLKTVPVLDLGIVASGYSLRILFGAQVFSIEPSSWLLISTFCAACGVIAAKRKSELDSNLSKEIHDRKVLNEYSSSGLQSVVTLAMGTAFTTYSLWLFENKKGPELIALSCEFLGLALLIQILMKSDKGLLESPEKLIVNSHFVSTLFAFSALNLLVIYR